MRLYLTVFTVVATLCTCRYFVAANWGDPPELQAQEDLLFAFGANETYIMETMKLPYISSNVGIEKWIYGRPPPPAEEDAEEEVEKETSTANNNETSSISVVVPISEKVQVVNPLYVIVSLGRYMIMEAAGPSLLNWTVVQDIKDINMYDGTFGNNGRKAGGADYRIYPYNGHYRVAFECANPDNNALQDQCYMDLLFDEESYSMYVLSQSVRYFNIDHEAGKGQQQKNWAPFTVKMETTFNNLVLSSSDKNLFIYSAMPHRIVHGNESSLYTNEDSRIKVKAFTVCNTEVDNVNKTHPFWDWGSVRGGTPAVIIDTPYGPKYMTVFHSQARGPKPGSWLLTYYMGAYLFDTLPPFAISHMTPDPIIPHVLYDEHTSGWAFKAIDYIIFPVGLAVDKDKEVAYVTLGRNDNTGYIVSLNLTTFLNTGLRPMHSKTLHNSFVNHIMHSDGQNSENYDQDDNNDRYQKEKEMETGGNTNRRMTQKATKTAGGRKAKASHHRKNPPHKSEKQSSNFSSTFALRGSR